MNSSGKQKEQLFKNAALTFAEALYLRDIHTGGDTNVFGRSVSLCSEGGLARMLGTSTTGVRSAAFIHAEELKENLGVLSSFTRLHVPFTLVIDGNALGYLPQLAQTGALVFQAHQAQALSDWILMAQVISEKSLFPVVVLASFTDNEDKVSLPGKKELRHWFGDNNGRVQDPTPAQTMVHGKMRRRMPGWIQKDNPVMLGAHKNHRDKLVEQAAQQQFDQNHVPAIIEETLNEFSTQFKRTYRPYASYNLDKARKLLLSPADITIDTTARLNTHKNFKKERLGIVLLTQLWPINLPDQIRDTKLEGSIVLEPAVYHGNQGWLFKEVLSEGWLSSGNCQNGWYVNQPTEEALESVLRNLMNKKDPLKKYWLDVAFTRESSRYPKYQVLLQSIARDYPEASRASLVQQSSDGEPMNYVLPLAARKFTSVGPPFARLSRFNDDTACLYDQPQEQIAHPFDTVPVLPAASAVYNYPNYRQEIPVFHPQKVKDLERYPSVCPHGALLTGLFTVQELIKTGIAQARSRGEAISLIVPLSKSWAQNAATIAVEKKAKIKLAQDILIPAFDKTLPMAKKDPELVQAEFDQIMMGIGQIPLALTENHFFIREQENPGSGELFTLAIDLSACTGCGSCALATSEGALEMNSNSKEIETQMITDFNRFDGLPETSSTITKRLIEDVTFDSFTALLLNKSLYRSFSRGGVFWQKEAESTTIGMITALAEFTLASNYEGIIKKISVQTAGINNAVKKVLSDALPVANLDSLMEVVTHHSEEKLNMDGIFNEWGKEQQFKAVNKDDLQRKLEVVEGLKQLKWALKEGLNGIGRSRYSIVLDSSVDYLSKHPWNTFQVPVIQAGQNETASLALGLFEGELRNTLDNIKLLRRAELEAVNKYKPEEHDTEIVNLAWENLTADEKALVAPLFILGSDGMLTNKGVQGLLRAQEKGYPIKIFILESGSIKPEDAVSELSARSSAVLPIMAHNQAFVGRGSLADANRLFKLLQESLNFQGPAVVSIFTPDAFAYDSLPALWPNLAMLAESTRSFLPFRYTPGGETAAACIEFDVTEIKANWIQTKLNYQSNGIEKQMDYTLTFADYAYLLKVWKPLFERLESDDNTIGLEEYLDLEETQAKSKIPVIRRVDSENKLVLYAVANEVVRATRAVQNNFQLLREWAGLHTAFPEKLREHVDAELRQEYDAEKKKLLAELAAEKSRWEGEHLELIKKQMKERLLKMTGQI